jgi:hypothetical protein
LRRTSSSCSSSRLRLRRSRNSADSSRVTPGRVPSSTLAARSQLARHDSEIPKSFATCFSGVRPNFGFAAA